MLELDQLVLHSLNRLTVNEIATDELRAKIQIDENQHLSIIGPTLKRYQAFTQDDSTQTRSEQTETKKPSTFKWKVENILLGDSKLDFYDRSVTPAFSNSVTIERLQLHPIDNAEVTKKSQLELVAHLNPYAKLTAKGSFTPFNPLPSADILVTTQALELVPLSPYMNRAAGYYIKHGQLNSQIKLFSQNGNLDSEANLHLNKLKLEPASEDARERINKQLTIPLDLALSTLRDKNQNIHLKIPIQGNLSNPDLDLSEIIRKASAKATRMASISLLKHTLQPYGTMITVAELAYKGGKKFTAVKLNSVTFSTASATLEQEQKDYLEKLAVLMEERSEIRLTLCGISVINELPEQSEKDSLLKLAQKRMGIIKNHFINEHHVDAQRLFACSPKIQDKKEEQASGRVELSL